VDFQLLKDVIEVILNNVVFLTDNSCCRCSGCLLFVVDRVGLKAEFGGWQIFLKVVYWRSMTSAMAWKCMVLRLPVGSGLVSGST
jgi:hypothetical protein